MKKKGAKIKKAPNEVKSPESVLQALWEDLDEQDDDLITNPNCMLQTPNGERSAVQVKSVRYDHAPEVHQQAARLERSGKSVEQVHFAVCKQKMETLRNYMNLKSAREVYLSNVH